MRNSLIVIDGHVVDYLMEQVSESQLRLLEVDPAQEYIGLNGLEWDSLMQACVAIGLVPVARVGGSGANTARWFARLGGFAEIFGQVGMDVLGENVIRQLMRDACAPSVRIVPGTTGRCLVFVRPDGQRIMRSDVGNGMNFDDISFVESRITSRSWLHLTGYLLDEQFPIHRVAWGAMDAALRVNAPISIDLGSGAYLGCEVIRSVVEKYPTILFLNRKEARMLGFESEKDAAKQLVDWTPKERKAIVVVTMGHDGAFIYDGRRGITVNSVYFPVRDTTGSGDAFAAGFLKGFSRSGSLRYAAKLGCVVAGATVSVLGGLP